MAASSEDDLNALAPVSPAAWLYLVKRKAEWEETVSVLSIMDRSSPVVFSPLLVDLTVDRDFSFSVRTPYSVYDGGVLTKVTSFCSFVAHFHNTDPFLSFCEDHGDVSELCREAREQFGIQSYVAQEGRQEFDMEKLCRALDLIASEVTAHVAFSNATKEFLYYGQLVPCPEEATNVQLGTADAVRVPLYPPTLFCGDAEGAPEIQNTSPSSDVPFVSSFVKERGLYVSALSEALFYYLFTCWGQTLRFYDTAFLIEAGMRQFCNDSQHTVKLASRKRYHGYMSQKLSSLERDQLMVSDAIACELGFSFASLYLDSAYEPGPVVTFSEWPVVRAAANHADLVAKLRDLKLHFCTHVAAQVFSANSVLYHNRIVFLSAANKVPVGGSVHDGLLRAVQFFNGLGGLCEDAYNDLKKTIKCQVAACREDRYSPKHLAWACSTSPHVVSEVIWYLNRMAVYGTGSMGANVVCNHIVNCSSNMCSACGGRCCHTCYATAFVRVGSRLPSIPKQPKKEPFVLTLFSKFMNDVDVMGSFGRRGFGEPKDASSSERKMDDALSVGGGGGGMVAAPRQGQGSNVDRTKYLAQIFDYCKKNSLIDANTGEDSISIRGKSDLVSVVSALNKYVDDLALRMVSDARVRLTREDITGATQSFNLDLNPSALCFSPLFTFQYYKAVLLILQNLALVSATSYVVDNPLTGTQISKWVTQHFQSICGAFSGMSSRKGFLFTRDAKCVKSVEFERLMDFDMYARSSKYVKVSTEMKLCRLSVSSLRSCRIKNRPISRAKMTSGAGTGGGGGSVFFRRDVIQKRNPLKGCLSFLLYRFHDKLFPECNMSCVEFWQKVCFNAVPKTVNIGKPEEFNAFMKFVFSVTNDYNECDLVDVMPDGILSYVEYRFHNKFLFCYGFRDYLSTIHGYTTRLSPHNHLQFPYLLNTAPKFGSLAEYGLHFKQMKIEGVPAPRTSVVFRESLPRTVFEQRSLVTVSFAIEKFSTVTNNRDIFQFGQIGYFVGNGVDRCLNMGSVAGQDYRFMRHRYILATKLGDVIIRKSKRENVLFDADIVKNRVLAALDSADVDCDPELCALSEMMIDREDPLELDDIIFYVDGQEALATSIHERLAKLLERGVTDFSLDNLKAVCSEREEKASDNAEAGLSCGTPGATEGTYDFSSFFTDDAAGHSTTNDVYNVADMVSEDPDNEFTVPVKRFRL
uniref:Single-stranded DNA-binding protein n=1 Tax=Cardioderma bat herpesvirus TaxID=3141914 RepID=A0AAU7DZU2_9VIRU